MRHSTDRLRKYRPGLWICSILAGCACLILILAGCSDDAAILDNNSYSEDNVSFFDLPYYPDALAKRSDILVSESKYFESRLSASSGGVIPLGDDADVESFVVLPASFLSDTTFAITVTRFMTDDGEMPIVYEFGPDGLQFSRPAVLRLNVAELFGRNVSEIELYLLNEDTNMFELVVTLAADAQGYVYGPVEHFSSYGAKASGGSSTNPGTDAK